MIKSDDITSILGNQIHMEDIYRINVNTLIEIRDTLEQYEEDEADRYMEGKNEYD